MPRTGDSFAALDLPPAGWVSSLLLFGFPALGFLMVVWVTTPWLDHLGVPLWLNVSGQLIPLFIGLSIAAIAMGRTETTGQSYLMAQRLRLRRMNRSDLVLVVLVTITGTWLYFQLQPLSWWIIENAGIGFPEWLGRFITPTHLLDLELRDNWAPVALYFSFYLAVVSGEELWWRGYVLPRQELAFGKHAWIVHGLLWSLFHVGYYWDILPLLPMSLGLSYVAQRSGSTWAGIIPHAVLNGNAFLRIVPSVISN